MTARNPEAVLAALKKARSILLISHISPDGDTIGSNLALRLGLERLGKTVTSVCADPVPRNLRMLPESDRFLTPDQVGDERFDLVMSVDCGDLKRTGDSARLFALGADTAQVDHHGTNDGFTAHNDVDADAPAVALLVHGYLKALGVTPDPDIASCLYAGLSTDTGNFAFPSTGSASFAAMAELMEAGLPLDRMNRALFRERPAAQVRLLTRALQSLRFYADDRVTVMTLTQRDFEECGALPEYSDTVVNFGLDIVGVKLTALVRETADGKVKASLRALQPYRVDEIAHAVGGGGHALAAGCTMTGITLRDAAERLRQAMEAELARA